MAPKFTLRAKIEVEFCGFLNDRELLLGEVDGKCVIVSTDTGVVAKTLPIPAFHKGALSKDKSLLATFGTGRKFATWDLNTFQIVRELSETSLIDFVMFSPDNSLLAVKNFSDIHIYEVSTGTTKHSLKRTISSKFTFQPNGLHFVIFEWRVIRVYDTKTFSCIKEIKTDESVDACTYTLDSARLVCTVWNYILVWDANTWELVDKIPNQQLSVNSIIMSSCGSFMYTITSRFDQKFYFFGPSNVTIKVWSTSDWKYLDSITTSQFCDNCAISPGSKFLSTRNVYVPNFGNNIVYSVSIWNIDQKYHSDPILMKKLQNERVKEINIEESSPSIKLQDSQPGKHKAGSDTGKEDKPTSNKDQKTTKGKKNVEEKAEQDRKQPIEEKKQVEKKRKPEQKEKSIRIEAEENRFEEKQSTFKDDQSKKDAKREETIENKSKSSTVDYSNLEQFQDKILGEGSFGEVYQGRYFKIPVAIKKLKKSQLGTKGMSEFKNEIQLLSVLRHPNIVMCLAYSLDNDPLIVLEYMAVGSLFKWISEQNKHIPATTIFRILKEISLGMHYLHTRQPQIIHRDLKSLNILLDQSCQAKISDFGLSKSKENSVVTNTAVNTLGSIPWAAPEYLTFKRKNQRNEKGDVYSFGVIIWELVTRQVPWREEGYNADDIREAVLEGNRLEIPKIVGTELKQLMQKCWHDDPSKRPSFNEIVNEIIETEAKLNELTNSEVTKLKRLKIVIAKAKLQQ